MNKLQLIDSVRSTLKSSTAEATAAVDAVVDAFKAGISVDGEVKLVGFGHFHVKDVPARTGRNPATGATIQIAAKKQLKFKPSKELEGSL